MKKKQQQKNKQIDKQAYPADSNQQALSCLNNWKQLLLKCKSTSPEPKPLTNLPDLNPQLARFFVRLQFYFVSFLRM